MTKRKRLPKAISKMELLRRINKGQTLREISTGSKVSYGKVYGTLTSVKKNLKPKSAEKLRMAINENRQGKFKSKKAIELTSFAKKILTGEINLVSKNPWKTNFPIMYGKNPKALKKIIHLLRTTNNSFTEVGKKTRTSYDPIKKAYDLLRKIGEEIPERSRNVRPTLRKASRLTGVFTEKQVKQILKSHEARIDKASKKMYNAYRPLFDFRNMGPGEIADYIRSGLEWKIKTFNFEKRQGTNFKHELLKYCAQQVKFLALDQVKLAKKNYQRVESLEKKIGQGDKKITRKEIVAAKEQKTVSPKDLMAAIERMAKQAKLDQREKAVVYGKAAGMTQGEMSTIVGTSSSFISYLINSGRAKMRATGFEPIRRKIQ